MDWGFPYNKAQARQRTSLAALLALGSPGEQRHSRASLLQSRKLDLVLSCLAAA